MLVEHIKADLEQEMGDEFGEGECGPPSRSIAFLPWRTMVSTRMVVWLAIDQCTL